MGLFVAKLESMNLIQTGYCSGKVIAGACVKRRLKRGLSPFNADTITTWATLHLLLKGDSLILSSDIDN